MFSFLSLFAGEIYFLVSYISQSGSFPNPLNAKEEQRYLNEYRDGSIDARNYLVEKNMRLVAHIAKKYSGCSIEQDDIISIGTVGLIKAINTFNMDKGIRLATYAARCIENEILMVIRSNKKSNLDISLEEPIGTDSEGNEISYLDIINCFDDDVIDTIELKNYIEKLYKSIESTLTKREKVILVLRYGLYNSEVKTQSEIAKMLDISRSYVSRIEKKAVNKLKTAFQKEIISN